MNPEGLMIPHGFLGTSDAMTTYYLECVDRAICVQKERNQTFPVLLQCTVWRVMEFVVKKGIIPKGSLESYDRVKVARNFFHE